MLQKVLAKDFSWQFDSQFRSEIYITPSSQLLLISLTRTGKTKNCCLTTVGLEPKKGSDSLSQAWQSHGYWRNGGCGHFWRCWEAWRNVQLPKTCGQASVHHSLHSHMSCCVSPKCRCWCSFKTYGLYCYTPRPWHICGVPGKSALFVFGMQLVIFSHRHMCFTYRIIVCFLPLEPKTVKKYRF